MGKWQIPKYLADDNGQLMVQERVWRLRQASKPAPNVLHGTITGFTLGELPVGAIAHAVMGTYIRKGYYGWSDVHGETYCGIDFKIDHDKISKYGYQDLNVQTAPVTCVRCQQKIVKEMLGESIQ